MEQKDDIVTKQYLEIINSNSERLNTMENIFVKNYKIKAIDDFSKTGIPVRKDEKYKYANVPDIYKKHTTDLLQDKNTKVKIEDIFKCDVSGLDVTNVFVQNGFYYSVDNKKLEVLNNGVIIGSLEEAIIKYPQLVEKYFGKYVPKEEEGLLAINSVLFKDGIFIYVPDDIKLAKPIQIIGILYSSEDTFTNVRNLFVIGKNSKAEIIFCDHTLNNKKYLLNVTTEILVDENANFNMLKMQNESDETTHFSHTYINLEKNAKNATYYISLNGGYIRNNLEVNLNGEGCDNKSYGLVISDRKQYIDNYVLLKHSKPNCTSTQLFKGILDGNSEVSFNGKIYVARDAQKTNAYQQNRNLLLSKNAKTNCKPQLEIYADDVKCSHGATTGKIDENAMFYLQSRGISKQDAKLLMMYAFADDVIRNITSHTLKDRITELTNARLRGELSQCKCCSLSSCDCDAIKQKEE